ncbi:hypothetical protein [Sphingomonas sp.]
MSDRDGGNSDRMRSEADAAKASFLQNFDRLRDRLNPQTMVEGAVASARDRGLAMAGQASEAVRSRPVAIGVALGLASLFWAARRKRARSHETASYPASYPMHSPPRSAED